MELLNETLDLLEKFEKERKVSVNSAKTIVPDKEENKANTEEKEKTNQRTSTTESNITRINSIRSSKSFELHSNLENDSDQDSNTDVGESDDEEFRSFPDETAIYIQNDKESIRYDANYYDYISQKKWNYSF